MKKILIGLSALLFCLPLSAQMNKDLDIKFLTMQRFTSDFVSDDSAFVFDLSGVRLEKQFNENVSAVLFPIFFSNSLLNNDSAVRNDFLTWGVYEAYIKVEDIGHGIGLWRLGTGETPWYKIEKTYYSYRYVSKPLAYSKASIDADDTGIYFNKSFMNNALRLYLGYHSGEGFLGRKDVDNAGAGVFTASFYPMFNSDSSLKDLSVNISINANTDTDMQNTYNALIGYKYYKTLSASIEYFGAFGATSADKIKAISAFVNYTFFNPYSILLRFDYTDDNGAEENYFLSGLATKMFDDALGVALTFALTDPCGAPATAKVLALNTVYYF